MYHIVCPAKYRRAVTSEGVDKKLREICLEIEAGYEIRFLEIGTELEHVDDLVQSEPKYSPDQIERRIKSIRAKKKVEASLEVKKMLREGNCGQGVLRGEGRSTGG